MPAVSKDGCRSKVGLQELQPDVTAGSKPLPLADRILRYLSMVSEPVDPKIIALRLKAKHSSVKGTLRRLAQKNLVMNEGVGYFIPRSRIEQELDEKTTSEVSKAALPKIHDIHLTFKKENIKTMLGQRSERPEIFSGVKYIDPNRGPDTEKLQQLDIQGYKNTPSLPLTPLSPSAASELDPHFLERLFSSFDPMSLYQLWQDRGNNPC
jgi:hypothetical protein